MEIALLHWLSVVAALSVGVARDNDGGGGGRCRFQEFSGHRRSFVCPITDAGLDSIPPDSSALRLVPNAGQSGLDLTIPSLPALRTLEVDVTGTGSSLSSRPFERLSRLTQLQLFHSYSSSAHVFRFVLVAGYFDGIPDLRRLFLPDLGIEDLPPGAFNGLGNLRVLELHLNQLWRIRNGTFSNCCRLLSRLTLSRNRIADLRLVSLSGLSGLQSLDLSDNRLSSLPGRSFDGLSNLVSVNLERNAIHSIHPLAFVGLGNLRELILNYNRLQGPTSGDVIGLSRSSFDGLTSLETLELKANGVTCVNFGDDELTRLRSLTRLDLSENRISFLSAELFADLSNLTDLDLGDNQLTTLDRGFLGIFNRMTGLDLSLNPWRCDCQLLWLTEWLRRAGDDASAARRERHVVHGLDDTKCSDPGAGVGVTVALNDYTKHDECKHRLTGVYSVPSPESTQTIRRPQTTTSDMNRHTTDTTRDYSTSTTTQTTVYVTNAVMTSPSIEMTSSSTTTEMTSPSTEMTSLSAENTSLSAEMTSLSAEITSPSTKMTSSSTEITSLSAKTTSFLAEMTLLSAKMTSPSTKVTSSSTEMTSSAKITSISAKVTSLSADVTSPSTKMTSPSAEMTSSSTTKMTSSSPVTEHDENFKTQDDFQTTEVAAEIEKPTTTVESPTVESAVTKNSTVPLPPLLPLLPLTTAVSASDTDDLLTSTSEADDSRRTSNDADGGDSVVLPRHLKGDATTLTISRSSSLVSLMFIVYESLR